MRGSAYSRVPQGEPRTGHLRAPCLAGHGSQLVCDPTRRALEGGPPWQRPEWAQPTLEVRFGNGPAAYSFEMAGPDTHRQRTPAGSEQGLHRSVRRAPDIRDAPASSKPLDLIDIGVVDESGDIDQVTQAAERLVRPRVDGQHDCVSLGSEGLEPLCGSGRGDCEREQLLGRRWLEPVDPLRRVMELDADRDVGPDQRLEVVDVDVPPRIARRNEARAAECGVSSVSVVDEEVDVPGRPHETVWVPIRQHRAFQDHHPALPGVTDPTEQHRDRQEQRRREGLLGGERRRDQLPGPRPSPLGQKLDPMVPQIVQ